MRETRREMRGVVAALLLGMLARVYAAYRFPFEQDELYTIDEATNLFHTKLAPGIQARPIFFWLEHPVVTGLPHTPLVLRALPFVFGILGLLATWAFARQVLGRRAGEVALLLAAVSPWHLYASAFGRYYSLLYLLATLVFWRLLVAVDSDRPRDYLLVLLPLVLGAWTHPSFAFPVAAAVFAVSLVRRDGSLAWQWPSKVAWISLWGPFIAICVVGLGLMRLAPHGTVANGGDRGLAAALRLIPAMIDWMTPIVFAAALLGVVVLLRSRSGPHRRLGAVALCGMLATASALFVLSFVTSVYADYGMAALPLVFVSAAALVEWVADAAGARARAVSLAVVALVLIGLLPSTMSFLSDGTRFDYRPAFARIASEGPGRAVLAWPIVLQRYYAPQFHAFELPFRRAALDSLLAREHTLWAVVSVKRYGIAGDDAGELATWLPAHCSPVEQYQRPRFDYRMYRVDLWQCATQP